MATQADLQDQLDLLTARLRDLATSMRLALKSGQTEALNIFRAQYKALAQQAATLRQQLNAGDAPSALLVQMDALADRIIATGKDLGTDVSDTLKGAATTIKLLPVLVVLALIAVGIGLYRGTLSYHKGG